MAHEVADDDDFLMTGKIVAAMVMSHSCELDKNLDRGRVQVAPIFSVDSLDSKTREHVVGRKMYSRLPLIGAPKIGDVYVDLRLLTTVNKRLIAQSTRIFSMTEEGRTQLQVQIVEYFTNLIPSEARE